MELEFLIFSVAFLRADNADGSPNAIGVLSALLTAVKGNGRMSGYWTPTTCDRRTLQNRLNEGKSTGCSLLPSLLHEAEACHKNADALLEGATCSMPLCWVSIHLPCVTRSA